ncbi:autotransporter-associated N-terminal domain-containing protein [Leptotrichia sp. oral taxon 223]|uniref:autotransporter-associated N-terminal domain-containing protein n=1 Tax=Leptotrichia sp. oral taxon 223 TaxID=712363 RepID=UPI0015BF4ABB|nr:autotransporter-associated N-terminal domain-containing protein [Leptotrichia sp. oral taxon 223]NWO18369.1 autotransporter-associated N-terminal domain-containing protein [Leptotrichia sp. oral taxon 223]
MTNSIRKIKQDLRAYAKRCKDVHYTEGLLITFLVTGTLFVASNLFPASANTSIASQKQAISTSIKTIHQQVKATRKENDKLLKDTNLELIQLMEQGDHVVKSPWSSWQYGINYFNNNWNGTYKGRGDKKTKYPYEGVFQRSSDIYERTISTDSGNYGLLNRNRRTNFASGSAAGYGLASTKPVKEPIVPFEINAGIRPRSINKSAIRIADKTAVTPTLPEAISFTPPKPVIGLPKLPELPVPPTFNIQLGSYCNSMESCNSMHHEGGQYGYGGTIVGTVRSFEAGDNINITTNNPSLRYGWSDESGGHSALLYSYFDVTRGESTSAKTSILTGNLTVTSINPVTSDSSLPDYNKQFFLVGGSRVATLDNVVNTTLENKATVNLEGPLTVGFEAQTDDYFQNNYNRGVAAFFPYASKQGVRGLTNSGTITDDSEKNNSAIQAHISPGNSMKLKLADFGSGHSEIPVKNTNGYLGYKVGMILTFENVDTNTNSNYILKNDGTIKINGEKSIGIQVFAPGSPSKVTVSNTGTGGKGIFMGGIESYGMKWSSRVASDSTMENTGTIEISGDAGTETKPDGTVKILDSLSSGIAVIENKSYSGANNAIRAYTGKVKNNGEIKVSGGKGNTGMVLIVDAADDITNDTNGTITVSSAEKKQNIAMRVDKGSISTGASGTPKAINDGTINLDGDSSIGMVGTNADVVNNAGKKIGTTSGKTIINGIGMATSGGKLENEGEIELKGTGVSTNVGVYMIKGTANPTGTLGSNSKITVSGTNSTGVLVTNGTLTYGGSTTVTGAAGVAGAIVGDNNTNTADVTATGGTITVNDGAGGSAGVYEYTASDGKTKVKKGSYGLIVGKGSKFVGKTVGGTTTYANIDANVKGEQSIGVYAGEGSKVELKDHTVKAYEGAVNYDADKNSTITLKGTGTATTGQKSLLFYLGEDGSGKVAIDGKMNATIEGGTTPNTRGNAFYYVGNGGDFGKTQIVDWAKNNFGDGTNTTLGNLTLNMNKGSRLFIAQNVGMDLSDTTGDAVSKATGAHINGTDYKTFMLYLSKLTINQDVNLDDANDAYNQLEISNSSITNANTKTITGTKANQVAMAQENNRGLYARNKVVLSNEGTINLSGAGSTGMYAKFGELYNKATGTMTIGDKSTAIYGIDDSLIENAGKITIGSNSTGLYSEGSTSQAIKNTGTIETSGNDSVAISYKPDAGLGSGTVLENAGKITMTGDRNTAIYATGTPGYTAKNSGTITLGDSASITSPNVGLYTDHNTVTLQNTGKIESGNNTIGVYGHNVENSGDLKIGNAAVGIYSQSGNVNLTGGTITTGTDEAVGVYTVGSGQTVTNSGTAFNIGNNSFGFVNVGTGNTITSSISNVGLGDNNVYMYSNDTKGTVTNSTNITSTGEQNYGIYSAGTVTNNGNIDLSSGKGSVAVYSIKGGTATNNATITVGASDVANSLYSIGMGAGYSTTDTGNIVNKGTINVNGKHSIGMYASGAGSTATNDGNIVLNASNTTGIYADNGATAINNKSITTGSGTYTNAVGVYLGKDSKLINNKGATINIDAKNGVGVYLKGGTVANYGTITVNGASKTNNNDVDGNIIYKFTVPETGKGVGGVAIDAPAGAQTATITVNGVPQTPVVVNTTGRNPITVSASSIGLYVNTSGVDYTKSIDGLQNLTSEADLIIGNEAAESTNSKYILVNDPNIINPYKTAMLSNPNIKWNVYSGSISWIATPTLDPNDGSITSLYMAKVPYTEWAGRQTTPVDSTDTYNFTDGLEQRYGVEALGTRERKIFSKLNGIGNNEEVLLYQAFDEMMGHQYGNLQQRINATGNILDKEFRYLKHDWRNPSKQNNKIKVFGARDEYNTDTAGIINYTSNAYGVAYVHEDEKIKMGNSSGWYAGAVTNRFKFKDIGHSRENQTQLKAGIFKTMSPKKDYNGALQWTIGGDVFVGINDMKRRYLVVDDVFQAKSDYHSYGAALKTDLGYDIRMSERTHLRPYGALKMEYGRFNTIKEDNGEMRLEVKGNDYFSVKPEVGMEFRYVQPLAVRTNLTVGLSAAYENELGKMASKNNQGRVRYTSADWFGIRGEKEDRRGNGKFDLNIGVDNTRFGVTVNGGYDTKGNNVRGGIGFRAIY